MNLHKKTATQLASYHKCPACKCFILEKDLNKHICSYGEISKHKKNKTKNIFVNIIYTPTGGKTGYRKKNISHK